MRETPLYRFRKQIKPRARIARPRVLIPVFPGTNSEYDSARAFEHAGAQVETFIFNNLTPADIERSTQKIAESIDKAQIVMLPGGFSAGDEPEGSGKFIATTLRHPRIAQAIEALLNERGGLMLGICNGFQALIKLGLLPFGSIRALTPNDPTLTFNSLGRHISTIVNTRVTSTLSPWLKHTNAGEVHAIAISHSEGRFVADDETLDILIQNGQIATQYVDFSGMPTSDPGFNPNGSIYAIEGITSPDGRIFGKMGHNERIVGGTVLNVPGDKDQQIFRAGVEYFL